MVKKWVPFFCIFAPAGLLVFAAHALAAAPNTGVCANGPTVSGVDVSDYQKPQSWTTTLQAGRQYAFVKATQGVTFVSPTFQNDWEGTAEAGLIRGAYHYFNPADDPGTQAQFFLSAVGTFDSQDLPPMLDWEETSSVDNDVVIARAQLWLTTVEQATGRTPVIYTNPNYWNKLGHPAGFDRYPLFIADYGVTCPTVPFPWTNWTFWQHGIGAVAGIQSNTDLDYFNGLLEMLKLL